MDIAALKKEAKSKKTPPHRLSELARFVDAGVQTAVANNPSAPPDALEYLGGHGKFMILKAVAKNPSAPNAVLERLAVHKQLSVREALLEHPQLPPKALEALALDLELKGFYFVAKQKQNLELAPKAVERLLRSSDVGRRAGVASYLKLSAAWLQQLLADPEPEVKASLTRNDAVPLAVHEDILYQADVPTRGLAIYRGAWTSTQLEPLATDPNPVIRAAVVGNRTLPLEFQIQLSRDTDVRVRASVAKRLSWLSLPKEIAQVLTNDLEPWVRAGVATNTADAQLLNTLAQDQHVTVRFCVACNWKTPTKTLEILAKDADATTFKYHHDQYGKNEEIMHLTVSARATWHLQQRKNPKIAESFSHPDIDEIFAV